MGAGLQQNEGTIWKKMTHSTPSTVFTDAAQRSAKASIEKKRKSSDTVPDTVQQQRRLRKYSRKSQSE